MDKGFKKLVIGGAAVLVLAAATAALLLYEPPADEKNGTGGTDSASQTVFENESADTIVVKTADREMRYVKTDGSWTVDGYAADELDQTKLQSFVSGALRYTSSTVINDVTDLSEYGLDDPAATVTVSGGGMTDVIEIGGKSAVENKYFAMHNGTVFTIQAAQYTKLLSEPSYFTEFTRVAIDPDSISEIRLERAGETIDLYIQDITRLEGNVWYMREPYEIMANDTFLDSDVLEQIGGLTMSRPAEALGDVRATLTVTADGTAYVFTVGAVDGGSVYVGYNGGVYKESASLLAFVDSDVFNYVNKLVSYINILDVSAVTFEYDGVSHTLTIDGDQNNQTFKADGADTDASEARTLYREIIGVSANAMYDGTAAGGSLLKVTFTGKDGNDTVIDYMSINEYNTAAFRNGTAYLTVSTSDIDRIKGIVNDFFSGE